jgi:hypothetical protein
MTVFIGNFYSPNQQYSLLQRRAYDEGPTVKLKYSRAVNTSSIDTRAFDAYRQGVEITLEKHTLGCFKISAGTAGHIVKPLSYGINEYDIVSTGSFVEIDYFDPAKYLLSQEPGSTYAKAITFPIITADSNQAENYVLNGVIEPLTIRPVISFFSIEWPHESHAFRGQLMGGNPNKISLSSDRVLSVDYRPTKLVPLKVLPSSSFDVKAYVNNELYLDAFETTKSGSGDAQQTLGYVHGDLNYIDPYADGVGGVGAYLRGLGVTAESHGQDMVSALTAMSASTENYIPPNKKSATSGFVYNSICGTDSIAFGDMVY